MNCVSVAAAGKFIDILGLLFFMHAYVVGAFFRSLINFLHGLLNKFFITSTFVCGVLCCFSEVFFVFRLTVCDFLLKVRDWNLEELNSDWSRWE
jgi:hypothetical protein